MAELWSRMLVLPIYFFAAITSCRVVMSMPLGIPEDLVVPPITSFRSPTQHRNCTSHNVALASSGWLSLALAGSGWLSVALAGSGWLFYFPVTRKSDFPAAPAGVPVGDRFPAIVGHIHHTLVVVTRPGKCFMECTAALFSIRTPTADNPGNVGVVIFRPQLIPDQ